MQPLMLIHDTDCPIFIELWGIDEGLVGHEQTSEKKVIENGKKGPF